MVEVLDRGVAAVEPRLVGHHPKTRTDLIQFLRHAQAVQLDEAGVGPEDSTQAPKRRRLAGAVLPQQDEDLTALDVEVHAIDGVDVTKALAEALDPDQWTVESRTRRSDRGSI